ncbi:fibronectin type III domain-containing protein [Bacillus velezensis]|uniref:fibronectin type III domain-containing protein n=1 Tax=Bacillus TaxID=1386 RepID=UPI0009E40BDB|nr:MULTISPECIES: fibronectin type III domain-containing protein [Bacillus]HEO2443797.1 fibronectin type III domain-containing protein [Streptococcus agalactiae]MDU0078267.1 fibronectin type III domain-containing protein [Bacillus sp. IG2]MDU0103982.1 fibronectin type III domain-containing protein [Bacillus sp. IS1]MDX7897470.1 fibronectin type III domain-containing protein [Bacillus velezensis]MDX8028500.1 fibronectin type III domain-containing protein [Bacillus velezensis]
MRPNAPQNLRYTATANTVTVEWDAVEGADSYKIYRGADQKFAQEVTETKYTANELAADTQLTINVTAVNSQGESPKTEIVTRTQKETP